VDLVSCTYDGMSSVVASWSIAVADADISVSASVIVVCLVPRFRSRSSRPAAWRRRVEIIARSDGGAIICGVLPRQCAAPAGCGGGCGQLLQPVVRLSAMCCVAVARRRSARSSAISSRTCDAYVDHKSTTRGRSVERTPPVRHVEIAQCRYRRATGACV